MREFRGGHGVASQHHDADPIAAVGRTTLAHDHDDDHATSREAHQAKALAKLVEQGRQASAEAIGEIGAALGALGDFTAERAAAARQELETLAATAEPRDPDLRARVRNAAQAIGGFAFAELLRVGLVQFRAIAGANDALLSDPVAYGETALVAIRGLATAAVAANDATAQVDALVAQINARGKIHAPIPVAPPVAALASTQRDLRFRIDVRLPGATRSVSVPALVLPGNHRIVPRAFELARGPLASHLNVVPAGDFGTIRGRR